jgi:hypothetical protein
MLLGCGFEPGLNPKTRWKKMDHLMAEKLSKIIKMGQVTLNFFNLNTVYMLESVF